MREDIEFTISFNGSIANKYIIDFYDVSQALIGFQRSLALTTHLVLNDQIITQAPSLKGAAIYAKPPSAGSWEITAVISILAAGFYKLGTTPKNTPIGHLIHSLYDYVISERLGFHVDYEKSLGSSYAEARKKVEQPKADALIEKCSNAVKEMHRPIYLTKTATSASIRSKIGSVIKNLDAQLDENTYDYIHQTFPSDSVENITGRVSSYNSNTYKGRIYVSEMGRPITFELSEKIRTSRVIRLVTASLALSAVREFNNPASSVRFLVLRNLSRSGHTKSFTVLDAN